jgi:uncharacterized protein YggU (UPF0235/DUF167 family)
LAICPKVRHAAPMSGRQLRLAVRLTPRGGRDAVEGWTRSPDGQVWLKARVAAAPADDAANEALRRMIAKALKKPASSVRIVAGAKDRLKQLEIDGLDEADIVRAFGARR